MALKGLERSSVANPISRRKIASGARRIFLSSEMNVLRLAGNEIKTDEKTWDGRTEAIRVFYAARRDSRDPAKGVPVCI